MERETEQKVKNILSAAAMKRKKEMKKACS